jgi:hypothetical protein
MAEKRTVTNPRTGRQVQYGSDVYKKLVWEGAIDDPSIPPKSNRGRKPGEPRRLLQPTQDPKPTNRQVRGIQAPKPEQQLPEEEYFDAEQEQEQEPEQYYQEPAQRHRQEEEDDLEGIPPFILQQAELLRKSGPYKGLSLKDAIVIALEKSLQEDSSTEDESNDSVPE